MSEAIETLLARNLHEVFGEHDSNRRRRCDGFLDEPLN
jgi:hypothetical protein